MEGGTADARKRPTLEEGEKEEVMDSIDSESRPTWTFESIFNTLTVASSTPPAEPVPLNLVKCPKTPEPKLIIVEQPKQRGMRFRYQCEGRSGGQYPRRKAAPKNTKTVPAIAVRTMLLFLNCEGIHGVEVKVCLVWKDPPYQIHPHGLVGKDCRDGICEFTLHPDEGQTHHSHFQFTFCCDCERTCFELGLGRHQSFDHSLMLLTLADTLGAASYCTLSTLHFWRKYCITSYTLYVQINKINKSGLHNPWSASSLRTLSSIGPVCLISRKYEGRRACFCSRPRCTTVRSIKPTLKVLENYHSTRDEFNDNLNDLWERITSLMSSVQRHKNDAAGLQDTIRQLDVAHGRYKRLSAKYAAFLKESKIDEALSELSKADSTDRERDAAVKDAKDKAELRITHLQETRSHRSASSKHSARSYKSSCSRISALSDRILEARLNAERSKLRRSYTEKKAEAEARAKILQTEAEAKRAEAEARAKILQTEAEAKRAEAEARAKILQTEAEARAKILQTNGGRNCISRK
ncbi:unnamed protein product [Ranitomeya imitator]|uniref:RHD domain-containing protein n=1 Tax=Ranitomeya imitator TaxID=111125 RepID=A0ABN9KZI4_9NEOB|nr:unnamed protein product [Ranitomeya imitator]